MKKIFLVLVMVCCLAVVVRGLTVSGNVQSSFGTAATGRVVFYPMGGTFGTNQMTDASHAVNLTNGSFGGVTLTGGLYEEWYLNRQLQVIFAPFNDSGSYIDTDLATNLTSYITFAQFYQLSNSAYTATVAAGAAAAAASEIILSNTLLSLTLTTSNVLATNFSSSNVTFALGTFYTNGPRRSFVGTMVNLITANSTEQPAVSVYVGNTVSNWSTTNTAQWAVQALGAVTVTNSHFLSTVVGPNQIFVFSNFNNGGTANIAAGTSTWVSW